MNLHDCSEAKREGLLVWIVAQFDCHPRLSRQLAFLLIAVSLADPAVAQTKAVFDGVRSEQAAAITAATGNSGIIVSVSPEVASVKTGEPLNVSARVQNDPKNEGVTWAVTGVGCSGSSCGTLINASAFSVTYVAPSTVPSPAAVTLTAASAASNTSSNSATFMVTSGALNLWISPTGATVQTNQLQQFVAVVSGTSNTAVTWEVNGVTGGNSAVGVISNSGLYQAPMAVPSSGTVTVTAVTQASSAISASVTVAVTTEGAIPSPLHGVTVADYDFAGNQTDIRNPSYLNEVLTSLDNFSVTPTVRITYTLEIAAGGGEGALASTYLPAMQALKQQTRPPFILGEVVDSSYMGCFTVADHRARWNDYVATLGAYVDLWEVGNEINGNWLDSQDSRITGCPWKAPKTTDADVITKMIDAYNIVKSAGKLAELTLYYPGAGSSCDSPAKFDPITWTKANVPLNMRNGLDYVLFSYYHQDCPSGTDPSASAWGIVFTEVQNLFPNAKIGFGEWGYSTTKPGKSALTALLNQGYGMDPYTLPFSANWVSGVLYWEFEGDAVPYNSTPGSIWNVINTDMQSQP